MVKINLRDYYPFYQYDCIMEVRMKWPKLYWRSTAKRLPINAAYIAIKHISPSTKETELRTTYCLYRFLPARYMSVLNPSQLTCPESSVAGDHLVPTAGFRPDNGAVEDAELHYAANRLLHQLVVHNSERMTSKGVNLGNRDFSHFLGFGYFISFLWHLVTSTL